MGYEEREEQAPALTMGGADVRRILYEHFEVREPEIMGRPVYLATCRTCSCIVAVVARVPEEIRAGPVLEALEHVKKHTEELREPLFP